MKVTNYKTHSFKDTCHWIQTHLISTPSKLLHVLQYNMSSPCLSFKATSNTNSRQQCSTLQAQSQMLQTKSGKVIFFQHLSSSQYISQVTSRKQWQKQTYSYLLIMPHICPQDSVTLNYSLQRSFWLQLWSCSPFSHHKYINRQKLLLNIANLISVNTASILDIKTRSTHDADKEMTTRTSPHLPPQGPHNSNPTPLSCDM